VERELVVVELFPIWAAVPRTFTDVLQRMVRFGSGQAVPVPDE
jgi:hypothetical protein